jgi:hypothetical protein
MALAGLAGPLSCAAIESKDWLQVDPEFEDRALTGLAARKISPTHQPDQFLADVKARPRPPYWRLTETLAC